MHEETELKLRIPEGAALSLRRSPVLSALKQRRGSRRHLLTVYYDTPSLALAKKGVSLRVRHMGRRKLQGIKLANGNEGGTIAQRPEIEMEIAGDQPEIERIPDEKVRKLVSEAAGTEPLSPAFVSDFGRTVWPLKLGDSEIEVALDQGEIRAGADRALPVSEVELELKSGRPDKLIELALALGKSVPMSVERQSKAERGMALVAGLDLRPVRPTAVELNRNATAGEAFVILARNCLAQLGGNEAAVQAGDAEGIHQMRVAARRLRALLVCFSEVLAVQVAAEFKGELRWLMGALGPARDLDVFISETLDPMVERDADKDALRTLRAAAWRMRERAHAEARATLATPRYTQFLLTADLRLASGDWALAGASVGPPARAPAQTMLRRRYRQLMKIGRGHRVLEVDELHKIRIVAKKMRYAGEFFRSLYPRKQARRFLMRLAELQDRLGSLNDAVTGRRLLEQLLPQSGLEPLSVARIEGLVIGWQAARIDADLSAFGAEWEKFQELKPFWVGR
ncbi:MAG TPA: CHAD domain-containing protein [Alphaproteobacteria bacterium]|nr:CHAD domain-containing protein [Alphaproteobacteria bacterium]